MLAGNLFRNRFRQGNSESMVWAGGDSTHQQRAVYGHEEYPEPRKRYGNALAEMVTLTMVALKKGHVCTLDDCVIAYLWFPRLGLCRPNAPW